MAVDTAEVNRLLAVSRAAHEQKKRNAGVINKAGDVIAAANYPAAEQHLVTALVARLDAHELDPEHTASGWAQPIPPARNPTPEAELLKFYWAYSLPFISDADKARVLARFPEFESVRYIP